MEERVPGQRRLADIAPSLNEILTHNLDTPALFTPAEIRRETVFVVMRDGIRLATDVYLPPRSPAPTIARRTPYGRAQRSETLLALAQRGFVVISQDCRGTGQSEPDTWDYYIYEPEDSFDFVEWVTRQSWFDGFLGGCGASYLASTQWCMAAHPRMSTIVPEVGGLGIVFNTVRFYMFLNAYARSVGKGQRKVAVHYSDMERQMLEETLAGGYFDKPLEKPLPQTLLQHYPDLGDLPLFEAKRRLWGFFTTMPPAQRVELLKQALETDEFTYVDMEELFTVFGREIAYGAHSLPCKQPADLPPMLRAPALLITGWYDWGLNDLLATWALLMQESAEPLRSRHRLLITPSAHNVPGYHEHREGHPELARTFRTPDIVPLLLRWYAAVREDAIDSWPAVIYYLMGLNEWRVAPAWPPPEARTRILHLNNGGALTLHPPGPDSLPDGYVYNPNDPPPTVGGSCVSSVYPPGSVDVSHVQQRGDVLTYTTEPLDQYLDVVGPLRMILYVSTDAVDTDFSARLSDVFPEGRAVQLQNGVLRARHRSTPPELLEPRRIYRLEIDMWATANRFAVGHRLRVDICSADFPRFDRNNNRGGEKGEPVPAVQTLYHDALNPSHIVLSIIEG